jgi:hypothetical protein
MTAGGEAMMNEAEVLRDVAAGLEGARVDYILTGSMGMNYYAQPRLTRDLDLVVLKRAAYRPSSESTRKS